MKKFFIFIIIIFSLQYHNFILGNNTGIFFTNWVLLTGNANFEPREFMSSVTFSSKIWVIGGADYSGQFNDIWFSSNGIDWYAATRNAEFGKRGLFGTLYFDDKIWVMGGSGKDTYPYQYNDVWYSSNGVDWYAATLNAEWSPREGFCSLVFDDKLWIISGYQYSLSRPDNDVWYSSNGVDWYAATLNAAFPARRGGSSVVFKDKMWIIAGAGNSGYLSDVWYSSNGIDWYAATLNAAFGNIASHTSFVFKDRMWVIGGMKIGPQYQKKVWWSENGFDWQEVNEPSFSGRARHTSVVFNNSMFVIGGKDASGLLNDVWSSTFIPVSYIYNSLDIFVNESRIIYDSSGSFTWANNWGNYIVPDVTLMTGPTEAYEAIVTFDTNNIIVTVVDKDGFPVDCSDISAIVNIRVYRHRSGFTW